MTDKIDDICCFLVRRKPTSFICIFIHSLLCEFSSLRKSYLPVTKQTRPQALPPKIPLRTSALVQFVPMGSTGLATGVQTQRAWQRFLKFPFLPPLTCSSGEDENAAPGAEEGAGERGGHRLSNEKLHSALPVKTEGSKQSY